MVDDLVDLNNLAELLGRVKQLMVKGLLYFSILTITRQGIADTMGR